MLGACLHMCGFSRVRDRTPTARILLDTEPHQRFGCTMGKFQDLVTQPLKAVVRAKLVEPAPRAFSASQSHPSLDRLVAAICGEVSRVGKTMLSMGRKEIDQLICHI